VLAHWELTFSPTKAHLYTLDIKQGTTVINAGVVPSVVAGVATKTDFPAQVVVGSQEMSSFTFQTIDQYDNTCNTPSASAISITISDPGGAGSVTLNCATGATGAMSTDITGASCSYSTSGRYAVTLTVNVQKDFTVSTTLNDQGAHALKVLSGSPNPDQSRVVAYPADLVAGTTGTIRIHLKDKNGNDVLDYPSAQLGIITPVVSGPPATGLTTTPTAVVAADTSKYEFTFATTAAGLLDLKVYFAGYPNPVKFDIGQGVITSPKITVNADVTATVKVNNAPAADNKVNVAAQQPKDTDMVLDIELFDQYGNAQTADQSGDIVVKLGSTTATIQQSGVNPSQYTATYGTGDLGPKQLTGDLSSPVIKFLDMSVTVTSNEGNGKAR
jgi:hypothetical protein